MEVHVAVCTSAPRYNVDAFITQLQSAHFENVVCKVLHVELPYNDIDDFDIHNNITRWADVVFLCHSINNRGMNITDVPSAIYSKFLPKVAQKMGSGRVSVVVHDLQSRDEKESSKQTLQSFQPTIYQCAGLVLVCSKLETAVAMDDKDWMCLVQFMKDVPHQYPPSREVFGFTDSLAKFAGKVPKIGGILRRNILDHSKPKPPAAGEYDAGNLQSRQQHCQPATSYGKRNSQNYGVQYSRVSASPEARGAERMIVQQGDNTRRNSETWPPQASNVVTAQPRDSGTSPQTSQERKPCIILCSSDQVYSQHLGKYFQEISPLRNSCDVIPASLPIDDVSLFGIVPADVTVFVVCHSMKQSDCDLSNLSRQFSENTPRAIGKDKILLVLTDVGPRENQNRVQSVREQYPHLLDSVSLIVSCTINDQQGIDMSPSDLTDLNEFLKRRYHVVGKRAATKRQIKVSVCTSAAAWNVQALLAKLRELNIAAQVTYKELPYNDLDKYKLDEDVDVLVLCHSILNRRFAITDVLDALYDKFLPQASRLVGKENLAVIVHDNPRYTDRNIKKTHYESFRKSQPTAFACAGKVFVCGKLEDTVDMDGDDWNELVSFLESARSKPKRQKVTSDIPGSWSKPFCRFNPGDVVEYDWSHSEPFGVYDLDQY